MKLLGSTKDIIDSDKNGENVPRLENVEEFSDIEVWFTDQNNNALEIEDNVNISLIINTS